MLGCWRLSFVTCSIENAFLGSAIKYTKLCYSLLLMTNDYYDLLCIIMCSYYDTILLQRLLHIDVSICVAHARPRSQPSSLAGCRIQHLLGCVPWQFTSVHLIPTASQSPPQLETRLVNHIQRPHRPTGLKHIKKHSLKHWLFHDFSWLFSWLFQHINLIDFDCIPCRRCPEVSHRIPLVDVGSAFGANPAR